MNYFFDYLNNNDNVKTLMTVLAFILSFLNTAYLLCTQKFKLKISFKDYTIIKSLSDKPLILGISIENLSRTPISVSKMYLYINNEKFEFSWFPLPVFTSSITQNGKKQNEIDVYSLYLPQNISSLGSCCGYFVVKSEGAFTIDDLISSKCSIEIHSSRGKRRFKIDFSVLENKLN